MGARSFGVTINSNGYILAEHQAEDPADGHAHTHKAWVLRHCASGCTVTEGDGSGGGWMNTGQWYHVVITQDGTQAKMYVDGDTNGTYGSTDTTVTDNDVPTAWANGWLNEFAIGYSHSYWTNEFNGKIDQFLIYDDALTHEEIEDLYNNGDGDATPLTEDLLLHYDF